MSVVARLLAARGVRVQGSDAKDSAVVGALRADGVVVHVGHAARNVEGADTLVLSSAVRPDNPSSSRRVLQACVCSTGRRRSPRSWLRGGRSRWPGRTARPRRRR
ncbi:Mur ligase domain-containing protein [Oerskovia sp. M15]